MTIGSMFRRTAIGHDDLPQHESPNEEQTDAGA